MTNAHCLELVGRVPSPPLAEEKPDTIAKMTFIKTIKQVCLCLCPRGVTDNAPASGAGNSGSIPDGGIS